MARYLARGFASRLAALEQNPTVDRIVVVTHMPIFPVALPDYPESERYSVQRAFLGNFTLGETVRRELFGSETGIGETVRIGRTNFTVVGTLAPKGMSGFGRDQDDVVMVPMDTARRRLLGSMGLPPGSVMDISLTVADARDLAYVQGEVELLLRQRHKIDPGATDDFSVRNVSQLVATRTQTVVVDTIAPESPEVISFTTAKNSSGRHIGTGLSRAQQVVADHGGIIDLEESASGGCAAIVEFRLNGDPI